MSQKNAESQEPHPVRQLAARLDRLHALIGTYALAVCEWSEAVDRSASSQLETVYGEDPPGHPRLDCPKEIEVMHLDEKGKAECKPYAEAARDLFSQLRTGLDDTANHVDGVHQKLTLACQHPGSKETEIALMVLDLKREIVQHGPPLDAGGVFEQLHKLRGFQQSGLISNLVNQIDWLSVCPVGESNNGDAKSEAAASSTKTQPKANGQERNTETLDTKKRRRRFSSGGPPEPTNWAISVYRLSIGTDMTQQQMADELSKELKRTITQSHVSRWIKRVRKWITAGNILPNFESASVPRPAVIPTDPNTIDVGRRTNATTPRQRGKFED